MGMSGHDQLQSDLAELLEFFRLGGDAHALFDLGNAGGNRLGHAVDLHHAHLTSAGGGQVRMRTQMGDIDIRSQGRVQDTHALFGLDLGPIYKQRNFAHLLNSLISNFHRGARTPAEIFPSVLYHTRNRHSIVFSSYFSVKAVQFA